MTQENATQENMTDTASPIRVTLWAVGRDFDDAFQPYFSAFDEEDNAISYASDQPEGENKVFAAVFALVEPNEDV